MDEKLVEAQAAGGNYEWLKQKLDMPCPQILYHLPPTGEVDEDATLDLKNAARELGHVRECSAKTGQWLLRYVPTRAFGVVDVEHHPRMRSPRCFQQILFKPSSVLAKHQLSSRSWQVVLLFRTHCSSSSDAT